MAFKTIKNAFLDVFAFDDDWESDPVARKNREALKQKSQQPQHGGEGGGSGRNSYQGGQKQQQQQQEQRRIQAEKEQKKAQERKRQEEKIEELSKRMTSRRQKSQLSLKAQLSSLSADRRGFPATVPFSAFEEEKRTLLQCLLPDDADKTLQQQQPLGRGSTRSSQQGGQQQPQQPQQPQRLGSQGHSQQQYQPPHGVDDDPYSIANLRQAEEQNRRRMLQHVQSYLETYSQACLEAEFNTWIEEQQSNRDRYMQDRWQRSEPISEQEAKEFNPEDDQALDDWRAQNESLRQQWIQEQLGVWQQQAQVGRQATTFLPLVQPPLFLKKQQSRQQQVGGEGSNQLGSGGDDDVRWAFLEIMSLLSDDSPLKMALWENPTTSRVLFSKLEELQKGGVKNSTGGKEMASLVLPNVIKAFQGESEETQVEFCGVLKRSPGFLSRCLLSFSEERKGGPVNEALFAIAEMDRKGLVVDQILQMAMEFIRKSPTGGYWVVRGLLLMYLRGPNEQAKISLLYSIDVFLGCLPMSIIPSLKGVYLGDESGEIEVASEVARFLYEVLVECEKQAEAPKSSIQSFGLIAVYQSLDTAVEALLEWNVVPVLFKHNLLLTCLKVSQCSNFALNVSMHKFVQRNYTFWVFDDDVGFGFVDVVTELLRLYGL